MNNNRLFEISLKIIADNEQYLETEELELFKQAWKDSPNCTHAQWVILLLARLIGYRKKNPQWRCGREQPGTPDRRFSELPLRAQKTLSQLNITTIDQLACLTEADLIRVKNCGRFTIKDIKVFLFNRGYELGTPSTIERSRDYIPSFTELPS